ncbi:MAG TPA: hypothetical protein VNX87_16220 [Candidatus Sulfotelmatobacter sp.]|jgi:hypothetical protein|nr:hypothetical protein [Candidatus Sulfotelmatobacter sp.]
MTNDFVIPPGLSPEAREAITRAKAAIEKHVALGNGKPITWSTIESQEQLQEEIRQIVASCPPGTFGTMGGAPPALETHQYKGFVIAIHAIPRLNGQYSTLSGIRKLGDPTPQEGFPLSEEEFSTLEAAVKAALEEAKKKIDVS